jgi:hypothetical protein
VDPKRLFDRGHWGKSMTYRAKWVLALDEAAKFARAATWEEWNEIWFGSACWSPSAARKVVQRLEAELARFGARLKWTQGHEVDARGADVRAIVEAWLLRARRFESELNGRRRKRKVLPPEEREDALDDDDVGENVVVDPRQLAEDYWGQGKSIRKIARERRVGRARVAKILKRTGPPLLRAAGKRAIERHREPEDLALALAVFDVGRVTSDVAGVLRCSTRTAWKFLMRSGRRPSEGKRARR